jgi:hypothetical protein
MGAHPAPPGVDHAVLRHPEPVPGVRRLPLHRSPAALPRWVRAMTDLPQPRAADHACPARRCRRRIPMHLLMCGPHWRMVPPDLQHAVQAAYSSGRGLGTLALLQAQAAAIAHVNEHLARGGH